jgi:endonuclease/exonuclease/phosphatase family metal-dependent hydrolase
LTRLATFNVLHGRALAEGRVSNQKLAEACAALDADVLCLQEIDRNQPRSGSVDQIALVAAATGAAAWRFEPAIVGEPGGRWHPAAGDGADPIGDPAYGVGIVSRRPVAAWHALHLAAAPVRSPVAVPGRAWRDTRFILLPDEPRVALVAELTDPDLLVATTHLSFVPGYNLVQVRRLARRLAALAGGRPIVLLGDLNVPGPLASWTSGWRPLAAAKTFPADKPAFQVDHVLGHGPVPPVKAVDAPRLAVSDHRALVVEIDA